jgi:hypothetical protein
MALFMSVAEDRLFEVYLTQRTLVMRMVTKGSESELEAVCDSITTGQWFSVAVHHTRYGHCGYISDVSSPVHAPLVALLRANVDYTPTVACFRCITASHCFPSTFMLRMRTHMLDLSCT